MGTDTFGSRPNYSVAPTEECGDIPISLIFVNPVDSTLWDNSNTNTLHSTCKTKVNDSGDEPESYHEGLSSSKDKFWSDSVSMDDINKVGQGGDSMEKVLSQECGAEQKESVIPKVKNYFPKITPALSHSGNGFECILMEPLGDTKTSTFKNMDNDILIDPPQRAPNVFMKENITGSMEMNRHGMVEDIIGPAKPKINPRDPTTKISTETQMETINVKSADIHEEPDVSITSVSHKASTEDEVDTEVSVVIKPQFLHKPIEILEMTESKGDQKSEELQVATVKPSPLPRRKAQQKGVLNPFFFKEL